MNNYEEKSKQLGMNVSTAMHKLRTKVLFHILKRHDDNICFKCRKKINTFTDLSIEHKKPWLYYPENNNRRFWYMSNIAFSHRKCNRPHRSGAIKKRKVGPRGTSWCCNCKKFLKNNEFYKHKSRWNGLMSMCKKCHIIKKREYRHKKRKVT